ncbi:hypothetical protein ElyMa_003278400 [Elysia marginata]|uniref:Shugoshin C-terminal domain-containing protein n=1 Tax=Elysia marginata TaxID=1093978 RepID=A0AAV4JDG7_9GAST|nr:hypothetical protein ElyMa_003278400 [Elysia marginata]
MRQNYDEMRNLREQNKAMHGDVRAIKEMLKASNAGQQFLQQNAQYLQQNVINADTQSGPNYGRHMHGQTSPVAPKGPGRMVGANISRNSATENRRAYNGGTPAAPLRESSQFGLKSITGRAVGAGGGGAFNNPQHSNVASSGYQSSSSTARLSVDMTRSQATGVSKLSPPKQTPSYAAHNNSNNNIVNASDGRTLPAICSLKDGVPAARQPSSRGRVIRKGSAVAKK